MPTTSGYAAKRTPRLRKSVPVIVGLTVFAFVATVVCQYVRGSTPTSHRPSPLHAIPIAWPAAGQAAISVLGRGRRLSPDMQPSPIASIAKVMTAYVVLRRDPMPTGSDGFSLTFDDSDVATAAADKAGGQSSVPVEAGETMTEREALEALLLPSANNIAVALADRVDGGPSQFVQDMNAAARGLGMRHTTYTDPSGFDPSTISTAADQLRLAKAAMRIPAFAGIVRLQDAEIPVAGIVTNTDSLLGHDGFVGIKTGSEQAAGGCFMFESVRRIDGHTWRIFGVVLGQTGRPLIRAGLDEADRLVREVSPLWVSSQVR